jgi:hypothetical protein
VGQSLTSSLKSPSSSDTSEFILLFEVFEGIRNPIQRGATPFYVLREYIKKSISQAKDTVQNRNQHAKRDRII